MKQLVWMGASLAMLGLSACDQAAKAPEGEAPSQSAAKVEAPAMSAAAADFLALRDEAFVQANASEADLTDLIGALPDGFVIDWDDKSFAPETGATLFTGFSIGFDLKGTEFGLRFDEAGFWGLETELLAARLQGERLDETGPLFTRLEGKGVAYYGFAAGVTELFEDLMTDFDVELPEDVEFSVDQLDVRIEEITITDAGLRPWELVRATADMFDVFGEADSDDEDAAKVLGMIHFGQQALAVSRSMEYGASVLSDTTVTYKIRQPGSLSEANASIELYGYKGVRGFDFDEVLILNSRTQQTSTFTGIDSEFEDSPFPDGLSFAQDTTFASSKVEDFRLDKVLGFLARSEVPSMDERYLMSLGRWDTRDYVVKLSDKTVFTAEQVSINADQFDWLIPTDINFDLNQVTVNIDELTGFGQAMFETVMAGVETEDMSESDQAEMEMVREGLEKAIALLPEHGLDSITFDSEGHARWGAETGITDFSLSSTADGFGEGKFDLALTLPVYEKIQAAYEAEDKEEAFEAAFEEDYAFRGLKFMERDGGGFDKVLGFAQAIGKEYPDQGWGAMLGNMDPPQMRSYLATIIRMGKAEVAREFPPAEDWVESFAGYIEEGGTFEFDVSPLQPLNIEMMERFDTDAEPDEIVDMLGISVTHTK